MGSSGYQKIPGLPWMSQEHKMMLPLFIGLWELLVNNSGFSSLLQKLEVSSPPQEVKAKSPVIGRSHESQNCSFMGKPKDC